MKKLLFAGGAGLVRLCAILAVLGLTCFLSPSSRAQTNTYSLAFNGFPDGSTGVNLTIYIGLDRKLKTDVPGHSLTLTISPPLITPKKVRLSLTVSASGSLSECNKTIATAVTIPFTISGSGRTFGASDFTGSGIGIQTSYTEQPCIDALSDKLSNSTPTIPNGIYTVTATLNDNATGAQLASQSYTLSITASSITEAILNLTFPANGDQVRQSPTVVFNFSSSISGKLLVFEHSNLNQSPDDATRDDNSPLKMVDYDFTGPATPQVTATNPGLALRPWTAGKKYSWYIRGSSTSSSGSTDIKKSPIWSFTVVSSDPNYTRLVTALQSAPDPVGTTFNNLTNAGYTINLTNPFYLQSGDNGTPQQQTIEQVLALLASLTQKSVPLKVGVTQ